MNAVSPISPQRQKNSAPGADFNCLFTSFSSAGLKDQSTGTAAFTHISIIGSGSSGSQTCYSGIPNAGATKAFTKVLMQGCQTGMGLIGTMTATVTDSSLNGNATNIYLEGDNTNILNLDNNFMNYGSPGGSLSNLGIINGGTATINNPQSYDQNPKSDAGQQ